MADSMSDANIPEPDAVIKKGGNIIYQYNGPVYNFNSCTIQTLHTHKLLGKRQHEELSASDVENEEPADENAEESKAKQSKDLRVRLSVIHPETNVSNVVEQPNNLSDEQWRQYESEKEAIYELYGRKGRDRGRNLTRQRELGKVWLKFHSISEERKKFLLPISL